MKIPKIKGDELPRRGFRESRKPGKAGYIQNILLPAKPADVRGRGWSAWRG